MSFAHLDTMGYWVPETRNLPLPLHKRLNHSNLPVIELTSFDWCVSLSVKLLAQPGSTNAPQHQHQETSSIYRYNVPGWSPHCLAGTTNQNTAIRDFPNISRMCIFFLVTLLACWSSFFWLDFSSLLFNCPYCRKLDFQTSFDEFINL